MLPHEQPESISILGVKVHRLTSTQAMNMVRRFMTEPRLHQVATVNPEFVIAAQQNANFHQVLNGADLCLPDGVGLILAGYRKGKPLPERVAGSDFVYALADEAARQGWRLYLLGAAPGVAEQAAITLQSKYPGLQIAGTYSGSPDESENEEIVERINQSSADVLYVAFGAPNQDLWIARNREALVGVRVAIGVGGSLDFIAGTALRAPEWVQRIGLEWLYRLVREPWRWKRMLALPRFAFLILMNRN